MSQEARGGDGGHASVDGNDSSAEGGLGGKAGLGDGGRGGSVSVVGDNAHARGGDGGRGGIQPGAPGGGAIVSDDPADIDKVANEGGNAWVRAGAFLYCEIHGGDGGEAGQPGGRGGRGARSYVSPDDRKRLGLGPDRGHFKLPYFEPNTEPGRGGDGEDTPQYMARRIILEGIKARHILTKSFSRIDVWYDRSVVPLAWMNVELLADGHRWQVRVEDGEYEFHELPAAF